MKEIHANLSLTNSKAKNDYRDRIDLLRGRLELLTGKDRLLMTMYLENGNSFRQLARLAGVSETSIARKINRITKRLLDGRFISCLRNRHRFTNAEMRTAKEHFLLGMSMKKIAAKRRCSYYRIRQTVRKIKHTINDRH